MARSRAWQRLFLMMAVLLMLSGCSAWGFGGSSTDNGKVTISLWYWNRSIDPALFREFEKQHPNIRINDAKIGGDYGSKLRTNFAGKAFVPDVVGLNSDVATYFPAADQFVDLYTLGAKAVQSEYLPWKWNAGVTPDGKMIAFPMDTGPTALFYRADLFQQAGLPTDPAQVAAAMPSWEAYFKAGTQLQQKLPKVKMLDNTNNVFTQIMAQQAKVYVTPDDQYIGGGDQVKRAWDLSAQTRQLNLAAGVNAFTPDWNAAMNNSEVASFVGAAWMKQILIDAAPNTSGKWRVTTAPGGAGDNGGSFMGITKYSKHPKEAFELIKFVQNPANQLAAYVSLNLFPSTPGVFDDPQMNKPETFFGGQDTTTVFATSARHVPNFYWSPSDNIISTILGTEMTNVAISGKNPAVAWKDAQDQIRRELRHKMPAVKL